MDDLAYRPVSLRGKLAKRTWLVFVIVIASCAPAGIDEPTNSTSDVVATAPSTSQPTPTTVQPDGPVTVITLPLPATPIDYGIYRDVIFAGAQMVPGSIEFTNWWATCIGEHGFSVTVIEPGHTETSVRPEQRDAHDAAVRECDRRSVAEGIVAHGISGMAAPDTLRLWYRAYVEVAYECLRENGYPTNPPPSVDEWVENYPNVWHPHEVIWAGETGRVDTARPAAYCSQDPVELLIDLGKRDEATGAP